MTVRAGLVVLLLVGVAGCGGGAPAPSVTGRRDGLELRATVHRTDKAIVVDTRVRNAGTGPVTLGTDLCGRVTVAVVAPEQFAPEGRTWNGSVQAAKLHVLRQQVARQLVTFEPRSPGDGVGDDRPGCDLPTRPVELAPGDERRERWVRSLETADGGTFDPGAIVRVAVVEDGLVDGLDEPDVFATGATAGRFIGRRVEVSQPLGDAPGTAAQEPTLGQLYDRLLRDARLRAWVAAQPESWHYAAFATGGSAPIGRLSLRLLGTRYVRAAVVIADADGTHASFELPTAADRLRPFAHRPATLPAGVAEIYEPQGFDKLDDVLTGSVLLPSGRLAVSDFFFDYWKPPFRLRPGAYRSFVTLAVPHGYDRDAPHPFDDRSVGLATLVISNRPTVRWERHGSMTTDGGLGGFSSAEAASRIAGDETDDGEWYLDRIEEAEVAYGVSATNFRIGDDLDVVTFGTGLGDGTYPIYIGYDAAGRPTRIVLDCGMFHLVWPG